MASPGIVGAGVVSILPAPAVAFLRALGPEPWGVVAGGRLRLFGEKQLAAMIKWVEHAASQRTSVFAMQPMREGMVRYLAVRAPRSFSAASMRLPASLIVSAESTWMLWALDAEVPLAEARRLSAELARQCSGVVAVGEGVPLPGTVRYVATGAGLLAQHQVRMLPPLRRAYRLDGGELAAVVEVAAVPSSPFMSAHEMKADAVEWCWDGLLPYRSATLLGGRPGFGKSMIAVSAAAIVSSGGTWPGGAQAERGSALVVEMEDDATRTTLPRLLAAGGDPRKVGIASALDLSCGGLAFLEAERKRRGDLRLVVWSSCRPCGDASATRTRRATWLCAKHWRRSPGGWKSTALRLCACCIRPRGKKISRTSSLARPPIWKSAARHWWPCLIRRAVSVM